MKAEIFAACEQSQLDEPGIPLFGKNRREGGGYMIPGVDHRTRVIQYNTERNSWVFVETSQIFTKFVNAPCRKLGVEWITGLSR